MGLRPSVKKEECPKNDDDSHYTPSSPPQSSQFDEHVNNSQPPSSSSPSSGMAQSSHQKTPLKPPQREAWTARGKLLLNFHDVISRAINSPDMARKCSRIAEELSDAENDTATAASSKNYSTSSSSKSIKEYSAEANLIIENKSKRDAEVRNKSLALGILTFFSLRGFPWMRRKISSYFQIYSTGMRSNYKFDLQPPSPLISKMKPLKNDDSSPQKSFFRKSFRFTFDVVFSTSMTLLSGTFLFMPSPASYIDDMSKLPLVEGKSVYAEVVCPPLMKEYGHVLMEYGGRWPVKKFDGADGKGEGENATLGGRNATITQEDVSLNVIRDFVANCSKRHKYEQALVEERDLLAAASKNDLNVRGSWWKRGGSAENDNFKCCDGDNRFSSTKLGTVAIPSPGVPEDLEIDLDQEVLSFLWDEEYAKENMNE
mmetsp:Transcript_19692/g.39710  ORF Transcript_19692/g.39710 Transcript_19692/m.39710 type:complete len:428 (+) Transcript_19692:199-1482(+)